MRFYVNTKCRCGHGDSCPARIYVNFALEPHNRREVPQSFHLDDPEIFYKASDVFAEQGTPINAPYASLMFLLDPWLSLVDWILPNKKEKLAVEKFNRSRPW